MTKNINLQNHVSVESTLAEALKILKPINVVEVHPSSRFTKHEMFYHLKPQLN